MSFDLTDPLPTGTTLLEASAGTGKTYTIAALATRYIAEGVTTIDQMLMITFGRSATRELRERVRQALTTARDALRDNAATEDVVIAQLLALPDAERAEAADRLARAVADFDAGTIATTHQFCQQTLVSLGINADRDPGEEFVENITEIIDEVVDDFYVRKYARETDGPRITYEEARTLARNAVNDPQASLDAGAVADGSIQAARVAFAKAVRAEVVKRRRARRMVTFDDLVIRLRDATGSPQVCQRLRDTYEVVLVDEFQDTDPAQWTILRRAFHGHRTLILIGDPKQAIYGFRGADVFSYLDAAEHADHQRTLPTNFRSDAAVVEGVGAIMGGLELGDPRITVHPVKAAHSGTRLVGLTGDARVRLRTLQPPEPPGVSLARRWVANDVAADIVDLLTGPARLVTPDGQRRVEPGDIAVLVGSHKQGRFIQEALQSANVPVVVASPVSVFATRAAEHWAVLLAAMQQPRTQTLRSLALTGFFGFGAEDLALRGEQIDTEVLLQVRAWSQILSDGSVAEMMAAIERDRGVAARLLSHPGGERELTDLRHLAGALHAHQRATRAGLTGLVEWLDDNIRRGRESERDAPTELTRRLETDADAVQVMTVHVSKGLEFPVAYVPFGWDRYPPSKDGNLQCHDQSGARVLDVRGKGGIGRQDLLARRDAEDAGEDLRKLYVALTRAASLLVVHWATTDKNTHSSPLHRVLSARTSGSRAPEPRYPVADAPNVDSEWVSVEPVPTGQTRARWDPVAPPTPALSAAPFDREVDTTWRRTSYSGLTASAHAEQHPPGFRDDEPDDDAADEATAGTPSPFALLPAGAAFGTLVHNVLEAVDTDTDDLAAEVLLRCEQCLLSHPVADVTAADLAAALVPVLHTPFAGQTSLADIGNGDRLAELDFELPLGGATLADVANLLRRHLPADDPLATYADRLDDLADSSLLGYLSGSIDAVLRLPGPSFLVVDYKTNLLRDPAAPGVEQTLEGYRPARLAEAMMDAHYPLQALLYSAALHRFLRWRLPDYDPQHHLGGVRYLFLRGMAGSADYGVFSWDPPAAMVAELSDLLDGRVS